MHAVEALEQALEVAGQLGYEVRQEYLGGAAGGACEFGGKKWIFVDLGLSTSEQVEQVASALQADPLVHTLRLTNPMQRLLGGRRAA